jgi:hypothetical protein
MKFMLIMQGTQKHCATMSQWSPAELAAHFDFMTGVGDDLARNGELVLAEGLEFPEHARVVTARKDAPPLISDGPFAETKEFLAGFWIVDVASRARAFAIAARISAAPGRGGVPMAIPIEVRQVMSGPPPE